MAIERALLGLVALCSLSGPGRGAALAAAVPESVMMSLQVDPQQEFCMYENVQAGWEIDASVLVFRGGLLDVKLRVEKPDGTVLYEQLLFSNLDESGAPLETIVKKGAKVTAPSSGVYAFCADNRMARWTAKVLTFELSLRDPNAREATFAALAAGASASETAAHSVAALKRMASRLHARLMAIDNAQQYHYHREAQHRDVIERTRSRVGWFGAAEGVVAIGLTAVQVILLRTWVTRKLAAGGSGLPRSAVGV